MSTNATHAPPSSPATTLLDALRRGDSEAATAVLWTYVTVQVPQLDLSWGGVSDVDAAWHDAVVLFPDLAYRPHTRHVGDGVVIDQGTVEGTQSGGTSPTGEALRTSVRVAVTHDDEVVRAITVDVDAPPVLKAMGRPVDAYAMAVSQVQALRMAHQTEGMETYRLESPARTAPAVAPGSKHAAPRSTSAPRSVRVAVVGLVLAGLLGGGAWAVIRDDSEPVGATEPAAESPTRSPTTKAVAPAKPKPSPTKKQALPPPSKKPTVVLKSDLAFGFDSAKVSQRAREAVIRIARQAREAGLAGAILVEGYTDNLGSARHGLKLSKRRADAVATILRDELRGTDLSVVARGLGERDPLRSNATAAGRAANRRVSITLPNP